MKLIMLKRIFFLLSIIFLHSATGQDYPKLKNQSNILDFKVFENGLNTDLSWYEEQNTFAKNSLNSNILKKTRKEIFKIYPKGGNYFESVSHTNKTTFYLEDKNIDGIEELYSISPNQKKGEQVFNTRKYLGNKWKVYIVDYIQPSWDGLYVAIALKQKGKSYSDIIVLDVVKKKAISGRIVDTDPKNASGLSWGPYSKSFLVNHYLENDINHPDYHVTNQTVCYYLEGFPNNNKVVFSPKSYNGIGRTENTNARLLSLEDKYVIGTLASVEWYSDGFIANTKNIFNKQSKLNWTPFFQREDKIQPIGFKDDKFYYISGQDKNRSICSVFVENPDFTSPDIIVPPYPDRVIRRASLSKGEIYFVTIKNGVSAKLLKADFDCNIREIAMEFECGNIELYDSSDNGPLYIMAYSWTKNYDRFIVEDEKAVLHPLAYNMKFPMLDNLVFKEIEYTSYDGTKIPLSLIYMKDTTPSADTSVFLYSYGAYGISVSPNFHETWYSWALNGGVIAFAHIRGGGEKGDAWHEEGKKDKKVNSWKDIIASAQYLISNNWTSKGKIALHSVSGGAVAAGMAINERPELFGCFVASMGVFNPYDFIESNLGKTNFREFGSTNIPKEKNALIAMDPFLNIKNQDYPAIFAITSFNDERVPFWQTAKYIAKLQEKDSSKDSPVVMRVLKKATHTNFGELGYNRAFSEMFAFCYEHLNN